MWRSDADAMLSTPPAARVGRSSFPTRTGARGPTQLLVMESSLPTVRAWCAGLLLGGLPVWAAFASGLLEPASAMGVVCAGVAYLALGPGLLASAHPSGASAARAALAAGAGAGVLVGILAALPTPTAWFMSDVAWHIAKVQHVARGHLFEDPILRVPTIYPFVYHALWAVPVALGAPLVLVMKLASLAGPAALCASFYAWVSRAAGPQRAAWAALALPLVFYSSTAGYVYLPTPFNASLVFVFLALRELCGTPDVARARRAGLWFSLAGLCWYGHLPWIVLALALWGWSRRAQLLQIVLGALPGALLLLVHLGTLRALGHGDASAIADGEAAASLAERVAGLGRNALHLSGGIALEGSAWWVGPLLGLVALGAWRAGRAPGPRADDPRADGPRADGPLREALLALVPCLLAAGLWMTFWQPFSARYVFVLAALALGWLAASRAAVPGTRWPLLALLACAAPWVSGLAAQKHLVKSRQFQAEHVQGGAELAAWLRANVPPDEPVFASTDTWDRAIGCVEPRANLVARRGGLYNFAPADVVGPRWADYQAVLAAPDAAAVRQLLAPYGFRYAVLAREELGKHPGLRALARGAPVRFENRLFLAVELGP